MLMAIVHAVAISVDRRGAVSLDHPILVNVVFSAYSRGQNVEDEETGCNRPT